MKKLITACATVMMAVVANAAAVTWNSGTYSGGFTNPDGNKMTTAMGFAMTVTVFSDSAGENTLTTSSSSTVNAMTGAITTTTADVLSASTTYYIQALIENDDYTRKTDIYSFTTPATGDATVNFTTGDGLNEISASAWGSWEAKGSSDVPEPTSGLLMLLGVAGLALKRRRA